MKKLLLTALVATLAVSACTKPDQKPAEETKTAETTPADKAPAEQVAKEAEQAANSTQAPVAEVQADNKPVEPTITTEGSQPAEQAGTEPASAEPTAEQKAPEDQKY